MYFYDVKKELTKTNICFILNSEQMFCCEKENKIWKEKKN